MRIVRVHGTDWAIDTADWGVNQDSGDRCSTLIERNLEALGEGVLRMARLEYLAAKSMGEDALAAFDNGYGSGARDAFDRVDDACSAAASEVMSQWVFRPEEGHNALAWPHTGE